MVGYLGISAKKVKNMGNNILAWLREHLSTALILLEFVLSAIFILVGYLTSNIYFRGVGVGLIIAWVTSALAYIITDYRKKKAKP